MKSLLIALFVAATIGSVSAQVKCVPDGRGGMCCWDMQQSGPFKPIGC